MKLTRAQLETKGLSLRTPAGLRILEVPAEFGWDDQDVQTRAEILLAFEFDSKKPLLSERSEKTNNGNLHQIVQYL